MDTGHAAWVLTSASLVLLMTPGLALFYGGMTRAGSVLNMMMMSFGAIGVVTVVYVLWGWSMSYGTDVLGDGVAGLSGNPFESFGLSGVADGDYVEVGFQMTFAILATALISGAIADRTRFSTWLVFCAVWVTLSYFPLAHMVWGGGFLSGAPGALVTSLLGDVVPVDYAGGTVVHINAGVAGLVLAVVVGE
ncbi:MAG: ammonium transporter, partial [Nocardioidaceae bacterium]